MSNFSNDNLEVLRPFGPTIAKVKMPQDLIDKLNEYTESILGDQSKQDKLNYGDKLAGNVKQEFVIEPDYAQKIGWGKFLAESVSDWIYKTNKRKITKFNIKDSWIIGDRDADINAGKNAGLAGGVQLLSGNGLSHIQI